MSVPSKYWMLVRIDATGKRKIREITEAKEFFAKIFPDYVSTGDIPDSDIQRQLLNLRRDASSQAQAERCLLCYISSVIEQVCLKLAEKFGTSNDFTCSDLLPYVLDDDGKSAQTNPYQSFSREILQSFDIKQGSLSTWTTMKVKQHPDLYQFLLECGVYLISDWAILNDTQPKQLEDILKEFHHLSNGEIQQAQRLLESYHTVYRAQRLRQRSKGIKGKCSTPTIEQLQQIFSLTKDNLSPPSSPLSPSSPIAVHLVMTKLQKLATQLREYRIYGRRGRVLTIKSLDDTENNQYNNFLEAKISVQDINLGEDEDERGKFLEFYHQELRTSLQQALAKVTEYRVKQLQEKKGDKAKKFIAALELFHCQKIPMADIASRIGLRAQDAVTRLLKLKEFRTDVRQEMLVILKDSVFKQAQVYSDLESIKNLENKITIALDEQISEVIEEAQTKSRTTKQNLAQQSAGNIFDETLCQHLHNKANQEP